MSFTNFIQWTDVVFCDTTVMPLVLLESPLENDFLPPVPLYVSYAVFFYICSDY